MVICTETPVPAPLVDEVRRQAGILSVAAVDRAG
jgi:hypothetical protein